MTVYWETVVGLNFLVDLFLLLGTNRLFGSALRPLRCVSAALLGGVYAGICLLPGFAFMGNLFWRMVSLCGVCVIAFGISKRAIKKGFLFIFLTMALGGIVTLLGKGGFWQLALSAAGVFVICLIGFEKNLQGQKKVAVVLRRGDTVIHLTALQDTGNTLKDPVTGESVLVVGEDVAAQLAGLSHEQLISPIETMTQIPGLRLVPFRSVGCSCGMMLAMSMDKVIIDGESCGKLVAFAPQSIGGKGRYQALAGGAL